MVVGCVLSVLALFPPRSSIAEESSAGTRTLKIGLITSITGPIAPTLKALADAAKPAQDLMNQRGRITIKGQKHLIEIIAEDDQSSPPGGVAAANKLLQAGILSRTE